MFCVAVLLLKLGANCANMLANNVVTVCACQATFLMFKISRHFERLLLDQSDMFNA